MAQQDAAEQAKEFLRQIIKYRFWISVSIAALFAVIAYFMGSGPVKAKTTAAIGEITQAEKAVKKFNSPTVPTDAYKPIVEEKTQIVSKDVNKAWKELYDRQAPLLTWPETVQARFRKWGRKWPETEDSARVQLAFVNYTYAYPAYVEMVYKSFNPFDYDTGKGVVAAPPKEVLLRPVQFSVEERPDLGKVWAAQERLWIQHTVLDVIAQVNKAATTWDSAIVKQIEALEVGNPLAQDQRSLANSEELKPADEILAPGQESSAAAEESGGGMMAGMAMPGGARGRGAMGAMSGMGGMGAMGGGASASSGAKYDDKIYYITPPNDKNQYKILPILVKVLIDQDRVQDFLVELENSPMSIQVMDFELARPSSRVVKPEKGATPIGGMSGMMGMMGGMGRMRGMMGAGQAGFGGMMGMMGQMGRGGMMREEGGMMGMMGGMRGGLAAAIPERKGTSIRGTDSKAEREKTLKEIEEKKGPTFFDPYFDIVEVTIYGRARFFLPPPEEPESEPSLGASPAATASPAGAAEEAPKTKPADAAATIGTDATKKPADEQPAAKSDADKPAAKSDADKPAAKSDTDKPAAKSDSPASKGVAPKS